MSPLERHYRRLMRLLPADDRDARGEELLGMLLDLDDGRSRPSVRQGGGVVALALRLRFVHIGSLLLAAVLIAFSTGFAVTTIDLYTGSTTLISTNPELVWITFGITSLIRLAAAIAWVLGARAVSLTCYASLVTGSAAAFGLAVVRIDLIVLVLLGFAVWRRWPAPGARPILLATCPLAGALWWLTEVWGRHGVYYPEIDPRVTWSLAALCGAGGWLLARRRGMLTRATAAVIGGLAPAEIPPLVFGKHTAFFSIFVVVTLIGVAGGALRRRSTAVPLGASRSPRGTTE